MSMVVVMLTVKLVVRLLMQSMRNRYVLVGYFIPLLMSLSKLTLPPLVSSSENRNLTVTPLRPIPVMVMMIVTIITTQSIPSVNRAGYHATHSLVSSTFLFFFCIVFYSYYSYSSDQGGAIVVLLCMYVCICL